MPQRKSALKELRKNRRRRMHNLDIKTDLKKTIKRFLASIRDKNKEEAVANLQMVYKKLDKAAKRNIMHDNTASRRKSRLSKLLKTLQ